MADNTVPPKNVMGLAPSLNTPGFRLVDAGELNILFNAQFSNQSGIVARGTTAATAFRLTAAINTVGTSAAGNNSLVLQPGLPGRSVTIVNHGAAAAIVFGYGGDQIVPPASSTPAASLSIAAGSTAVLVCIAKSFTTGVAVWKAVSVD